MLGKFLVLKNQVASSLLPDCYLQCVFPIFAGNMNKTPLYCTFGVESDSNIVQPSVWKYGYFLDEHILHMILLSINMQSFKTCFGIIISFQNVYTKNVKCLNSQFYVSETKPGSLYHLKHMILHIFHSCTHDFKQSKLGVHYTN